MTTDTTALRRQAEQYIDYLGLPDAIEKLGATVCLAERVLLKMSLRSCTPLEANERLEFQIKRLREKLGRE